ncbi:hypothetical protein ACOSQ4_005924 [Xanthoceras sorbifolium]
MKRVRRFLETQATIFQEFSDKVVEEMYEKRKSPGDETTTNTTWSPWMDNIIETPKNEEECRQIEERINNAIYGLRKTHRRLPVFEEICPSMNEDDYGGRVVC